MFSTTLWKILALGSIITLVPVQFQNAGVALTPPDPTPAQADAIMHEGIQLAQRGAFEDASIRLTEAAALYDRVGEPLKQADAMIVLAQVYVSLGFQVKAAQSLELALTLAQAQKDLSRQAAAYGALGQVYLAAGRLEAASLYLNEGLGVALQIGDTGRAAVILNELGRLHAVQGDHEEALQAFGECRSLSRTAELSALEATATLNAGQSSLALKRSDEADILFGEALEQLRDLPDSHDKAYGLITVGLAYRTLASQVNSKEDRGKADQFLMQSASALEEAGAVAEATQDHRAISYAYGHRGHLYEERGRYDEALLLTRIAVQAAQQVQAPESLYLWEWQTGRIFREKGNLDQAIAAYQRAKDTLQSIRPEMAAGSAGSGSSFRESGGPVFFELADLLLRRAASASGQTAAQPDLKEARRAVELFKSAELRDYFRDDCVDAFQERTKPIDEVLASGAAAVIYPILLEDRTELLVSLPGGIERFSVQETGDRITKEVRAFRRRLEKRTTRQYLPHAQQLYEWLIRPLEPRLKTQKIDTLVIVPDGALRTIPMAALHDGKQFLIEKYAVASTPGLDLTDPHPLPRGRVKVLTAGLTESVQGYPPLPFVKTELQTLEQIYGAEPLVNGDFVTTTLQQELRETEFAIVHVASHGQFKAEVGDSFILTFDGKVNMNQLSELVGYFRFREEPLELLTLSACETAAGDDRAALGLAGVAIKAGARSALATLWYVNDQSSSALVAEFYRELQTKGPDKRYRSKAQALQLAQITLLSNPKYGHPAYWAPFLILNNWL